MNDIVSEILSLFPDKTFIHSSEDSNIHNKASTELEENNNKSKRHTRTPTRGLTSTSRIHQSQRMP